MFDTATLERLNDEQVKTERKQSQCKKCGSHRGKVAYSYDDPHNKQNSFRLYRCQNCYNEWKV